MKDTLGLARLRVIRDGHEMLAIDLVERGADSDAKDSYGILNLCRLKAAALRNPYRERWSLPLNKVSWPSSDYNRLGFPSWHISESRDS